MSSELDFLSSVDIEIATLKKEYDKGAEPSSQTAHSPFRANRKPIVLAVDDKPDILNSLRTILYMECKFFGVPSGAAAIDFIKKNETPDLYILDIEMPGMNGFELAKTIERMGKKTIYMFLTGNSDRESVLQALGCGASDFIVKPCRKKVILQKFYNIFGD